jgi:hypothetical protein
LPTTIVGDVGATLIDATGVCWMVSAALADFPSLVAVMVAVPAATPVATPSVPTVATSGAELLHVTVRSRSVSPFASSTVATSGSVVPMPSEAVAGST